MDFDQFIEPDENILWKGAPSESWELPLASVGRFFSTIFLVVFLFVAVAVVAAAIINDNYGLLLILFLFVLYKRWKKVNDSASAMNISGNYYITDQRVIFPDFYKSAKYQSIPLQNLNEIKVSKTNDFTDVIFREESVRGKGKFTTYHRYTYGFKGLDQHENPEPILRDALKNAENTQAFFTYSSQT